MKMYWLPFFGHQFTKSFYKANYETDAIKIQELHSKLVTEKSRADFYTDSTFKLCSELENHKQLIDLKIENNEYIVCLVQYNDEESKRNITIEIKSFSRCIDIEQLFVLEAVLHFDSKTIELVDIVGKRNKGYGTQAINALKQIGKFVYANLIVGNLCPVDLEDKSDLLHKDRLYHFYNKNGFKITETNDPQVKRITYVF